MDRRNAIDLIRERRGLRSDAAVARRFGMSRQRLSDWIGDTHADTTTQAVVDELADLLSETTDPPSSDDD